MNLVERIVNRLDPPMGCPAGRLRYALSRLLRRPYFGTYLASRQGDVNRHRWMRKVACQVAGMFDDPINILEVGSWAGASAILWAEFSTAVVCIDHWRPYLDTQTNAHRVYRTMDRSARNGAARRLFLHNVACAGMEDRIIDMRGDSDRCLPLLRPLTFHLVYIDGDHSLAAVERDLQLSAPLVVDGGVLCGDDLEAQLGDVSEEDCLADSREDYACRNGVHYHPGVTLAVGQFFKRRVSAWDGFWAMRRRENGWDSVDLA